jgi:hypothetical protein
MSRVQYITKSIARTGIGGRGSGLDRLLDMLRLSSFSCLMPFAIGFKVTHEAAHFCWGELPRDENPARDAQLMFKHKTKCNV